MIVRAACLVGVIEYLQKQMQMKVKRSIYTAQVVIWLMIVQRLQPRRTLAGGVEALMSGAADRLLSGCERAKCRNGFRGEPAVTATPESGCPGYYASAGRNCSFDCAEFSTPKPAVARIF